MGGCANRHSWETLRYPPAVSGQGKIAVTQELVDAVPSRRLDGDWLACDSSGMVALFLGGEHGILPRDCDPEATAEALVALERAAAVRREMTRQSGAYRELDDRAQEPVLDAPRDAGDEPLHEHPWDGYPHVLFCDDASRLRNVLAGLETREVTVRASFALEVVGLPMATYELLHFAPTCGGCAVVDRPDDPRPRSPTAAARAGLYVYAHSWESPLAAYVRVASPSVPAGLDDVEPAVAALARAVALPVRFEDAPKVAPALVVPVRR